MFVLFVYSLVNLTSFMFQFEMATKADAVFELLSVLQDGGTRGRRCAMEADQKMKK